MTMGIASGYRIHSAKEPLDTVMNPRRPDGWTCDDESPDSQPYGVSACSTLKQLATYISTYSLAVRPGDRLLALEGTEGDDDADGGAIRIVVDSYEILPLSALLEANGGECPRAWCAIRTDINCPICAGVKVSE